MITFGLFVFSCKLLNVASRTVDSFMIIGLKGLEKDNHFTIASYLVTFMDLPFRSYYLHCCTGVGPNRGEQKFRKYFKYL